MQIDTDSGATDWIDSRTTVRSRRTTTYSPDDTGWRVAAGAPFAVAVSGLSTALAWRSTAAAWRIRSPAA